MEPSEYEKHEQLEAEHWWFVGRRRCLEAVLDRHLRPHPSRTILDVGCGTGGMFPLLQRYGRVSGAEFSADARARAARRFPQVPVSPCRLPDDLPPGEFSLVTAFDVLEHLDEPVPGVRALAAKLEPQGQLLVTVPAYQFLFGAHDVALHHRRRYSRALLHEHLRQGGLRVRWDSFFNTALFPAVAVARVGARLFGQEGEGGSDLRPAPRAAGEALKALFGAEGRLLARGRLPFGVSLVAVAERV